MADFNVKSTVTWTPRSNLGQFVSTRITPAVRNAVAGCVDIVVAEAKSIAPVRTGYMRDHITGKVEDKERTVVGAVTSEAGYSGFVEFGTVHMEAQPFMRPALDTARERIRSQFSSAMSVALK